MRLLKRGIIELSTKKGCGSLRVTHIRKLSHICPVKDVIHHSGQIIDSDIVPLKIPEGLQQRRLAGVSFGVGVASGITHPHIVARFGQQVCQPTVRSSKNPIRGGTQQTVHKEDNRAWPIVPSVLRVRYAVHCEDVTIRGLHLVLLDFVTVSPNNGDSCHRTGAPRIRRQGISQAQT